MREAQEVLQLHNQILGQGAKEENSADTNVSTTSILPAQKSLNWWIRVAIYSLFLLAGQSVATLLGRLYYDKGGNSKWMAGLVQPGGFLILFPLYLFSPHENPATNNLHERPPSVLILASAYTSVGILLAAVSMMYSLGYLYLPVSTYSLICASQLGFNAFFSLFLNSLKFTPFIINSLVLLTISSILLVFEDDSAESTELDKAKYAIGFICTLAASAGYGLMLSLTQFFLEKVVKKETFKVFSIGAVGLIAEVSSVFSNVISTLGLPVVPVLAVVFFHDKMDGLKAISMVLAIWGFVSYVYQHYLDDCKSKIDEDGSTTRRLDEEREFL
ncbi:Purine permease [Melia azedarach]|uniref:Purine permease n=1 Tax=Melia azedarach TaxID=155640 RepID=A0ACC1X0S9_MELAZ|nr:Purine permease [Melia azedarach]